MPLIGVTYFVNVKKWTILGTFDYYEVLLFHFQLKMCQVRKFYALLLIKVMLLQFSISVILITLPREYPSPVTTLLK